MTNLGKVGNTDYCCCCTSSSKQRGFCKGMTTKIIPAAVAFGSLRGKNLMGRYGDGRQHREVAWLNWNQFILENRRHRWQSQTHGKKIYNNSAASCCCQCRTYNLDVFLRRLHGCEMCQLSKRFGLRPFQIIDDTIGSFFLWVKLWLQFLYCSRSVMSSKQIPITDCETIWDLLRLCEAKTF